MGRSGFCENEKLLFDGIEAAGKAGDGIIAAAGFMRVRYKECYGNRRTLAGRQQFRKAAELLIQDIQVRVPKEDLPFREAGLLIHHFLITGERGKRRKLGSAIVQAHVRTGGRLVMGTVDDVAVNLAGGESRFLIHKRLPH